MGSIYAKTRQGQAEIEMRSGAVPQRARRLLILIDGKRGRADLAAVIGDADLDQTLAALEEEGYIEAVAAEERGADAGGGATGETAGVAQLPPTREPKEVDMARHFMMNTLKTFNGPYAKLGLLKRIHDSDGPQALRALFDEWLSAIQETQAGRKRADELRGKLFAVL